jgi:hypothetical protein
VPQLVSCHTLVVRRIGLEPIPGCPEGILSPPATFRNPTSYPVVPSRVALGFVRVGAFCFVGFRYQNRYQQTFHVAHLISPPQRPVARLMAVGGAR